MALVGVPSPVGQLHQVIGGEAVFVRQHVVVGGAAGALQPGVRVEVERVLEGVLQGRGTVSVTVNLRLRHELRVSHEALLWCMATAHCW
jgi:hypothetical protein